MDPLMQKRQQILQQMEQIRRMERGSIQEESRPSKRHCECDCGPYYKHQVWENGHNKTRRVPKDLAQDLSEAIAGRQQFERLADDFIDTTIAMTRAQTSPDSKKNCSTSKPRSKKRLPDTSNNS